MQRPKQKPYITTCGLRHSSYERYAALENINFSLHSYEENPGFTKDINNTISRPGGYVIIKQEAPRPLYYRYFYDGRNSRVMMTFWNKRYSNFAASNSVITDTLIQIRDSSGIVSYKGYFRPPVNGLAPSGNFHIFGWMIAQPMKEQFFGPDGKICQENIYSSTGKFKKTRFWNETGKLMAQQVQGKLTFYFKDGRTEFNDTVILGHSLHCRKRFDRQGKVSEIAYYKNNKEVHSWLILEKGLKQVVKSKLSERIAAPKAVSEEVLLTYAEESPEYPGGYSNLHKQLQDCFTRDIFRENEFWGRYEVIISIERDGTASIDSIIKFPAFYCKAEICSSLIKSWLAKAVNKKWRPGRIVGRPVKFYLKLNFKLEHLERRRN